MPPQDPAQGEWSPLVSYLRNGVPECTIHGSIAWAHGHELFHSFGGDPLCYGRSLMKPHMIRGIQSDLVDLTQEQKAIAISSHNGDENHLRVVESLLGADLPSHLQTPASLPLMPELPGQRFPRPISHSCSGEHAAILHACQKRGWDLRTYLQPAHPFFQAFLAELRTALGEVHPPAALAMDGCGLGTPALRVSELALLYADLANRKNDNWIWKAMNDHPELVGGPGRLDTAILRAAGGYALAKEGADGLLGIALEHADFPRGFGIAIKIAHGWDMRAAWYVARHCLAALGISLGLPEAPPRQKVVVNLGSLPDGLRARVKHLSTWEGEDPDSGHQAFNLTAKGHERG